MSLNTIFPNFDALFVVSSDFLNFSVPAIAFSTDQTLDIFVRLFLVEI